jgi:broad specificity phosphatase PhoE
LNNQGRQQALAVVGKDALGASTMPPISVVVSSHLKRASQTADILHEQLFPTAKRVVKSEFAEMSFGSFEGLAIRGPDATPETLEQFQSFNDIMKKNANEQWPGGGESTEDVAIRAQRGLKELLDEFVISPDHEEEGGDSALPPHIAIVAHGRTNKVILESLLTGDVLQYGAFQQGNTCINVVDLDADNSWTARTLNYVGHIQGDLARAE